MRYFSSYALSGALMSPTLFGLLFGRSLVPVGQVRDTHYMKPFLPILIASIGVFLGSLLSDVLLGDGIQSEDINQAAMVALIAGAIQWWLSSRKA